MNYKLSTLLLASLLLASEACLAAVSVGVKIEFPKGSAAGDFSSKVSSNVGWTGCIDATAAANTTTPIVINGNTINNANDFFTVTVSSTNLLDSTTNKYKYDMYVFIVNPSADGTTVSPAGWQYYALHRRLDGQGVDVHTRLDVTALTTNTGVETTEDAYLTKEQFLQDKVSEILFGGSFAFDAFSLPQGLWQTVVILADRATVDFKDPSTWAAWDTSPFVLGTPWKTSTGTSGSGTCQ